MEYVGELRNSLLNYQRQTSQATLGDYLQQISLITTTEDHEAEKASVSLMTVHNAKGLEFETVIIAGFEKDLFPHFLAERDGDISEERRLFYVAVTRAKSRLYLTQAERRMRQGFYEQSKTSPFLNEIPHGLLRVEKSYSVGGNAPKPFKQSFIPRAPAAAKPTASSAPGFGSGVNPQNKGDKFSSGDKILHSNFGKGRVLRLEGDGDSQRIHILFDDGKTRKFILKFTDLKLV